MQAPEQYQIAITFEKNLGDPGQANNLLSFRNAIQLDEDDAFPEAAVSYLQQLGLHRAYVPRSFGGEFHCAHWTLL